MIRLPPAAALACLLFPMPGGAQMADMTAQEVANRSGRI